MLDFKQWTKRRRRKEVLRYMTEKPVPLTVVDTHAGAGLYRLDGDAAATSGEVDEGLQRLRNQLPQLDSPLSALIQDYLEGESMLRPRRASATFLLSELLAFLMAAVRN